jgi:hypothetical protein
MCLLQNQVSAVLVVAMWMSNLAYFCVVLPCWFGLVGCLHVTMCLLQNQVSAVLVVVMCGCPMSCRL